MENTPSGDTGHVVDFVARLQQEKARKPRDPDERRVLVPRPANDSTDAQNLLSADVIPFTTEVGIDQLADEFEKKLATAEHKDITLLVEEFISTAKGLIIDSNRLSSLVGSPGGWNETDKEISTIYMREIPELEAAIAADTSKKNALDLRERGIAILHSVAKAMKYDLSEADKLKQQRDSL